MLYKVTSWLNLHPCNVIFFSKQVMCCYPPFLHDRLLDYDTPSHFVPHHPFSGCHHPSHLCLFTIREARARIYDVRFAAEVDVNSAGRAGGVDECRLCGWCRRAPPLVYFPRPAVRCDEEACASNFCLSIRPNVLIFYDDASGSLAPASIFFPLLAVAAHNTIVDVGYCVVFTSVYITTTKTLSLPVEGFLMVLTMLPSLTTYKPSQVIGGSNMVAMRSSTPSTRVLDSPQVRSATHSAIIRIHSFVEPTITKTDLKRKFQKNCSECTRAHRRCVFPSIGNTECFRCTKMHLKCYFIYSGTSNSNDNPFIITIFIV